MMVNECECWWNHALAKKYRVNCTERPHGWLGSHCYTDIPGSKSLPTKSQFKLLIIQAFLLLVYPQWEGITRWLVELKSEATVDYGIYADIPSIWLRGILYCSNNFSTHVANQWPPSMWDITCRLGYAWLDLQTVPWVLSKFIVEDSWVHLRIWILFAGAWLHCENLSGWFRGSEGKYMLQYMTTAKPGRCKIIKYYRLFQTAKMMPKHQATFPYHLASYLHLLAMSTSWIAQEMSKVMVLNLLLVLICCCVRVQGHNGILNADHREVGWDT